MADVNDYIKKYDAYSSSETFESNMGFTDSLVGDPDVGWLGRIWNDLTGKTAQDREFAQQEYLQDKQNEYNTPAAQMLRMKAAGINPNLAAGGISQGGNESAQAPPVSNNTSGVSAGVNAVGSLASGLGSGLQSIASVKETNTLLSLRADQIRADTIKSLEDAGLSHWNAVSIATMLPYMEANSVADFYLKLAQFDKTHQEYVNLLAEHDKILSDIDLNSAEIDLMEQSRLKEAEFTRWHKQENDFFDAHGYRSDTPLDVSLRDSVVSGRVQEAESIGGAIETASNRSAQGAFVAEANNAYNIAYQKLLGQSAGSVEYDKYLNQLEMNKIEYTALIQSIYAMPNDIKGLIVQYLGKSENIALRFIADAISENGSATTPKAKYHEPYRNPHNNGYKPKW